MLPFFSNHYTLLYIQLKATCINSDFFLFYSFLIFCFTLLDIILVHFPLDVYSIIQGSFGHSLETCLLCKALSFVTCMALYCSDEMSFHFISSAYFLKTCTKCVLKCVIIKEKKKKKSKLKS